MHRRFYTYFCMLPSINAKQKRAKNTYTSRLYNNVFGWDFLACVKVLQRQFSFSNSHPFPAVSLYTRKEDFPHRTHLQADRVETLRRNRNMEMAADYGLLVRVIYLNHLFIYYIFDYVKIRPKNSRIIEYKPNPLSRPSSAGKQEIFTATEPIVCTGKT